MSPDDAETRPDPHLHTGSGAPEPAPAPAPAPARADSSGEATIPRPPTVPLSSLDPRVVAYWRVNSLISSVLLLGLALFIGGWVALNVPGSMPLVALIGGLLLLVRLWMWWWHPARSYRAWGYRVEDRVIEIRQGIWFRTIALVPLSRLQHVALQRGPIERSYGLATLILFTAGTQHASIRLPGLEAGWAADLRDRLVAAGGDDAV